MDEGLAAVIAGSLFRNEFSDTFWPAFWATLAGVFAGGAVALWVDRKARKRTEAAALAATREAQRRAIELLEAAVRQFEGHELPPIESVTDGELTISVHWPLGHWAALRSELAALDDHDGRVRIFEYFALVEMIRELVEFRRQLYVTMPVGLADPPPQYRTYLEVRDIIARNVAQLRSMRMGEVCASLRSELTCPSPSAGDGAAAPS